MNRSKPGPTQIAAIQAFGAWMLFSAALHFGFFERQGLPDFMKMAMLCCFNLASMGKLFANLAEAVSSVVPIQSSKIRAKVVFWAGLKMASLLSVIALFSTVTHGNVSSSLLGLSGWIIVPLLFGIFERRIRRG